MGESHTTTWLPGAVLALSWMVTWPGMFASNRWIFRYSATSSPLSLTTTCVLYTRGFELPPGVLGGGGPPPTWIVPVSHRPLSRAIVRRPSKINTLLVPAESGHGGTSLFRACSSPSRALLDTIRRSASETASELVRLVGPSVSDSAMGGSAFATVSSALVPKNPAFSGRNSTHAPWRWASPAHKATFTRFDHLFSVDRSCPTAIRRRFVPEDEDEDSGAADAAAKDDDDILVPRDERADTVVGLLVRFVANKAKLDGTRWQAALRCRPWDAKKPETRILQVQSFAILGCRWGIMQRESRTMAEEETDEPCLGSFITFPSINERYNTISLRARIIFTY
jgi:hypothetical protein